MGVEVKWDIYINGYGNGMGTEIKNESMRSEGMHHTPIVALVYPRAKSCIYQCSKVAL